MNPAFENPWVVGIAIVCATAIIITLLNMVSGKGGKK